MLASTVQFSNNDQTLTLNIPKNASHETGSEVIGLTAVPSGPNNVPDTPSGDSLSTPKQY
jgi:hypothetical protein